MVWAFTAASNRHGTEAFVPHGDRLWFYGHDDLSIAQLVAGVDVTLFAAAL